jgi:photosystem II stability/assembly factor-like uncharacterized protein
LSIYFTDANTCYVGGSSGIYKSSDGGNSWTNLYYNSSGILIMGLFFPNLNTGYATGINGLILKTTDAGLSWTQQTSGVSTHLASVFLPMV